ncbi:DNA (cytosine-5)-methyltransferase 1 [Bacillus luteolus]|nr:DNA (cytosine-5)-methyltransferase 1 [Cytobacillus luteolus]
MANEKEEVRGEFYKHLHPKTEMIIGDITEDDIRNTIINKANALDVNLIIATPPCQGMSRHGKRELFDPRNQLITYAIDVIKKVKPMFVLLENVPKQLTTRIDYFGEEILIPEYIKRELEEIYHFNTDTIVNSADFGVPQRRERSIFLLSRKDQGIVWEHPVPKKKKQITLREAIGELPSLDPLVRDPDERWRFPNFEEKKEEGLKVSKWHYPPTHSWKHIQWMMHTPSGKTAFENNIYYPKKDDGTTIKGRISTYKRYSWDKPANTITQNNGVISSAICVHPGRLIQDDGSEEGRIYSDARVLTIYELLIVSSLPTNWNIPTWATETTIRNAIGEGIPPLLIKEIFRALLSGPQPYRKREVQLVADI